MTRDLRKYARSTSFHLIIGGIILVFILGDGLVYLIYGSSAALMGFLCLMGGMIPVLLVVLIILILDRITKHINRE